VLSEFILKFKIPTLHRNMGINAYIYTYYIPMWLCMYYNGNIIIYYVIGYRYTNDLKKCVYEEGVLFPECLFHCGIVDGLLKTCLDVKNFGPCRTMCSVVRGSPSYHAGFIYRHIVTDFFFFVLDKIRVYSVVNDVWAPNHCFGSNNNK